MIAQQIYAFLLMQLPWIVEVAFDAWMWYKFPREGSDKPWSTWIVRPIAMAGATWGAAVVGEVEWYYVAPLVFVFFGLLFTLVINWINGKSWDYYPETTNKWTFDYWAAKIPWMANIWGRVWLVILFVCTYFYYGY